MGHALQEAEMQAHLRFKTSQELYLDPTLSVAVWLVECYGALSRFALFNLAPN